MKKSVRLFLSLLLVVIMGGNVVSQDVPTSLGPAPLTNITQAPSNNFSDMLVGTRAFTQGAAGTGLFQFGKSFLEGCTSTNTGAPFSFAAPNFPGGLVNINGSIYTWNQASPYQLYRIDTTTGTHTLVVSFTGVPLTNLTGLTWDGTTVYGIGSTLTQSQIFTANIVTGLCTPIGVPSAVCAGAITLSGRKGGDLGAGLFAVDIVADNLYRFNKVTGVATLVGALGQNANFGQDAQFDNNDGKLYWAAYTTAPQLRSIDTATGGGALLCSYTTTQATGIAMTDPTSGPPAGTLYSRCKSVNLSIPDNNNTGVTDTFVVAGLPTTALITRVQIRMDSLIHTWVGDLRITVNKGATTVTLCRNPGAGVNGSNGNDFIGTTFSDSARYNIDSILNEATTQGYLSPPGFSGYFRTNSNPPNTAITSTPLSLFNGVSNPNGVWTFNWKDSALQDVGSVRRYCVMIDYVDYTGITQTGTEIPNKYFVNQNYPNPFNPVTNIKFGLPNAGNVKLVIFDILGREVATLVNEFKAAGQYTADFDASMLSSGAYFYRIEAGDFVETKKMLLVK